MRVQRQQFPSSMFYCPPHLHSFPTRRSSDLSGHAYRCYCTKEEMAAAREAHAKSGAKQAFRYPNTCRNRKDAPRSEEHTSELQSRLQLVCRLQPEKKKHQSIRLEYYLPDTIS